jgi:lipopolysaccharide assembly outer membrane protein LptD (OstA)
VRVESDWDLSNALNSDPYHRVESALLAPLTPVLAGFTMFNWERTRETDLLTLDEMILGVEYDGCCWHLQLAGQRTVNDVRRESSEDHLFDTIILTVTLKGLGTVGRRNNLLERVTDQLPGQSSPVFMTE